MLLGVPIFFEWLEVTWELSRYLLICFNFIRYKLYFLKIQNIFLNFVSNF